MKIKHKRICSGFVKCGLRHASYKEPGQYLLWWIKCLHLVWEGHNSLDKVSGRSRLKTPDLSTFTQIICTDKTRQWTLRYSLGPRRKAVLHICDVLQNQHFKKLLSHSTQLLSTVLQGLSRTTEGTSRRGGRGTLSERKVPISEAQGPV